MARECKNCKSGLVSKKEALIGTTKCTETCPTDVTCEDILPSNCIFYSGPNLICSGVNYSDSITAAIAKLDAKLCENQTNSCLFKISSNDTCCGYFQTKILAGTGITFTIANEGACETLTIAEGCYTWNNILASSASGTGRFRNGWRNLDISATVVQTAQYSSVKECTVRLRGSITIMSPYSNAKSVIAVLPAGFAPILARSFSATIQVGTVYYPGVVAVYPSGSVELLGAPIITGTDITLSLDGIFWEIS